MIAKLSNSVFSTFLMLIFGLKWIAEDLPVGSDVF